MSNIPDGSDAVFPAPDSAPGPAPLADLSGRRILVIGGGGFIGRHTLAALRRAGASVAVMDVTPAPAGYAAVDWITGSILDSSLVASAVAGCQGVVFLANSSLPGSSQADLTVEVTAHVGATIKVAEICDTLKVGRFVFASSGGTVYGHDPGPESVLHEDMATRPLNAYGVSKLSIEHYLRILAGLRPMRTLSLRLSNPYGEGQRALRAQGFVAAAMQHGVEAREMTIWGDGSVMRDFIHVADVAEAFVAGLGYGGPAGVINIGSGQAVSVREMATRVGAALGRPLRLRFEPGRAIDVRRNVLDITRARRELGWAPRTGLEQGLAKTAEWWLKGLQPIIPE